jgi:hypothetical protein
MVHVPETIASVPRGTAGATAIEEKSALKERDEVAKGAAP